MSLSAEDDAIVAEIALRRGWVDRETLRRALEIQSAASVIELDERLLDILATKGFITERQARELDEAVGLGRLLGPQHAQDIEGYRILDKLGQGGMGAVFKAIQLSMKRLVALKVLSPELAADPRYVERFQREARAIGRVSHPNVVGGLDCGRSGDYLYYAMEYVEGRTLYEALADGPLSVEQVVSVAEQTARALCHIESLGLVHRDVKPSNIILSADGVARLCDLGLARAPDDPSVTDTGIPVGTPHYAAPELAAGRKDADIRCDIYALGGTLYRALTGEYPFKAEGGASLLQQHLAEPLLPPAAAGPGIPDALNDLIVRMMAKDPRDRFPTAAAVLEAVEALREALPAPEPGSRAVEEADLPRVAPPLIVPRHREDGEEPPPSTPPVEAPAETLEGEPQPEEPEAEGRGRLVGVLGWGVLYVALVALLVGAVVWALRSRGQRGAAKPPATDAAAVPGSAAQAEPTTESPARPPPPELPDRARELAEEALAFDAAHPQVHAVALLKLRRAALAARDGVPGAAVTRRLEARQKAVRSEAGAAYRDLRARVQVLRERDEFGRALAECAAFPHALRYGETGEQWEAAVAKLGAQAERRYLELALTGGLLLQQGKLEDGLRSYGKIGELGVPWVQGEGERLVAAAGRYAEIERRHLDELARRRGVDQRRRSFGQLTDLFKTVKDLLERRQYDAALSACKKARQKLGEGPLSDAVARPEGYAARLAALWEALGKNPPQVVGRRFKLYGQPAVIESIAPAGDKLMLQVKLVGAASHRRPLRKLPVEQYVEIATWALDQAPEGERAVVAALIHLAEGERDKARERARHASALGANAASLLQEFEAGGLIAGGLKARDAKEWAKARQHLETALDDFPGTMAVVLGHREVYGALQQALAQVGEALPAGPPAPTPLPVDLRRLGLLPETRLAPTPPADPLEAYRGRPLRRSGPTVLGLDNWRDYTLELEWTPERGEGFVLLFRLSEPSPGQFTYYFLGFDGRRLRLGRVLSRGVTALDSRPCGTLSASRRHRAVVTVRGAELVADVDETYRLRAEDSSLRQGNIAVASRGATLVIHRLGVLFPSSKTRQP